MLIEDCSSNGNICLPIPLANIFDYTILDNGQLYSGGVMGCDFDTMFAYTYYTIPNQGSRGPYQLVSWMLNGASYTGTFNSLEELVAMMNQWDENGNWKLNASTLTIQGGVSASLYSRMSIEQINTNAAATLELNTNLVPMGTQLSFEKGMHEIVLTNKNSSCSDKLMLNISCESTSKLDCPDFIPNSAVIYQVASCNKEIGFCVAIPKKDLGFYTIDHNGSFYTGQLENCTQEDSTQIKLYAPVGKHVFSFSNELTGCSEELIVKVECPESKGNSSLLSEDLKLTELGKDRSILETGRLKIVEAPILKTSIKVYNGLSPNRDGINDYFTIDGLEAYPDNELKIYNRFGQLLYEQKNYQSNWNGEVDGVVLPNGTYFYLLSDGEGKQYSGFLEIKR